ncbi:glycosyltransferase [uncultured Sphingomonas sp.]|uniref:glycosyltransferase n=1 Tax=uncultured Sphingomonas sp. TaxID=158754 RepID=UPI0035CA802E
MRKIVLATIGTLGDLHPFIAIGIALKQSGCRPVLAVPADHVERVEAAGLEAVAIFPCFDAVRQRMGLNQDAAVEMLMRDQRNIMDEVLFPELASSARLLDAVAQDADAIVGSIFAFAAPIVCEKRGIPLFAVVLQPMAMLSPYDPPRTPDFRMLRSPPVRGAGLRWNRLIYAALRLVLQRRYGKAIDRVRAEHGLPPRGARRLFEPGSGAARILCCYSTTFGPLPLDAPANARSVGFPVFDAPQAEGELDPALAEFLGAGAAPLVFTLGSFAVLAAGNFYVEAAKAARLAGRRAVLLTGNGEDGRQQGDLFITGYAPHSKLFPRAAAIVHHGGVGTTGRALASGKPQLVVPYMGDQFDHAHRIRRMGIGRVLEPARFTADRALPLLNILLEDGAMQREAARIGALIAAEDGAGNAARAILDLL